MRTGVKTLLWMGFVATLVVSMALGLFVAWLLSDVLPPGTVVTIDNERFVMPAFAHFGHWLSAIVGVMLVALLIVVLVPLVLLLVLVASVVAGGIGLLVSLAPVALLGWLVFLLVRRLRRNAPGATTIAS
jgi:hypothetical protein